MEITELEKELLAAVGLKRLPKGTRQDQLQTLVEKVNELDDDDWRGLSGEAQAWFNKAADAGRDETDIADFPMETSDAPKRRPIWKKSDQTLANPSTSVQVVEVEESEPETEAPQSTKSRKQEDDAPHNTKGKQKEKVARSTEKAARPTEINGHRHPEAKALRLGANEGVPILIRKAVCRNPEITTAELIALLKSKKRKVSITTVSSIRSGTISVLRMLQAAGNLTGLSV
jgi:hypothetical protein